MRLTCLAVLAAILATPVLAQDTLTLNGVIDMHVHQGPDSGGPREIDADDLARLAQKSGMRGLVMKNHWESTAARLMPPTARFCGTPPKISKPGACLRIR